jgi:hypothetical protein
VACLLLLPCTAAYETTVATGQQLADAVAAFGASGQDTVIGLKPDTGHLISLANVSFQSLDSIAAAGGGRAPFSGGTLIVGAQLGGPDVVLVSHHYVCHHHVWSGHTWTTRIVMMPEPISTCWALGAGCGAPSRLDAPICRCDATGAAELLDGKCTCELASMLFCAAGGVLLGSGRLRVPSHFHGPRRMYSLRECYSRGGTSFAGVSSPPPPPRRAKCSRSDRVSCPAESLNGRVLAPRAH